MVESSVRQFSSLIGEEHKEVRDLHTMEPLLDTRGLISSEDSDLPEDLRNRTTHVEVDSATEEDEEKMEEKAMIEEATLTTPQEILIDDLSSQDSLGLLNDLYQSRKVQQGKEPYIQVEQKSKRTPKKEKDHRMSRRHLQRLKQHKNLNQKLKRALINRDWRDVITRCKMIGKSQEPTNFSIYRLSKDEKSLLSMGPGYVPTPSEFDTYGLHTSIDKWINAVRYKVWSKLGEKWNRNEQKQEEKKVDEEEEEKRREKLKFRKTRKAVEDFAEVARNHMMMKGFGDLPRLKRQRRSVVRTTPNQVLETGIKLFRDELVNAKNWQLELRKNLSRKQRQGWNTLKRKINDGKIIVACQEEGCTVILEAVLEPYPDFYRIPPNYALVKDHKIDEKWNMILDGIPMRLITSISGCPTEGLGRLVDFYLAPLQLRLECGLLDIHHCLHKVLMWNHGLDWLRQDIEIPAVDIVNFYPSVDLDSAIPVIHRLLVTFFTELKRWLDSEGLEWELPSPGAVCDALKYRLTHNISVLFNKLYTQLKGGAMGPAFTPAYWDLAIILYKDMITGELRDEMCMMGLNFFRDDAFMLWKGLGTNIFKVFEMINGVDEGMQFKFENDPNKNGEY